MRILCLIPSMNLGGAQRVMSYLVSHFASQHEVILMTWEDPSAQPFYEIPDSVKYIRADLLGGRGLRRLLRLIPRPFRIRTEANRLKPEILLSFMDTMNITVLLAAFRSDIPVIVSERTDPEHHSIGGLWRLLRRVTYPWASVCVVQTRKVEEFCHRIPGVATEVLPNPVPQSRHFAQPDSPNGSGRYTIITLGRLSKEKGYDNLLTAFSLVAQRHSNWDLLILGEGPQRSDLESTVKSLNLQSRVSMPGSVANPKEQLAASHIMAFPSLYEGFPNALAEGMAAGLPVIGNFGVSGVEDLVQNEETGLLVSPNEGAPGLARALDLLMSSPSERRRLGNSAQEFVSQWAPEKILSKWDKLISDTAKKHETRRNKTIQVDKG